MQTTHTHRIDVVVLRRLTDAVVQLLPNGLLVGQVVPFTVLRLVPFRWCCVVEQQWLAVARRNHDAPFSSHTLTLWMTVECTCAVVHGRCQHVATQTQQELAHLVVCLWSYIA